jgi:large subunit ribosomal protein L31e
MAKEKKPEKVLERIYVIPLRQDWLKVPRYKRAKKAIKTIKKFLVRHMKLYDQDLSKVKIDLWLNRAIWCRGIKNVPYKVTVKAVKDSDGQVFVELVSLPKSFKQEGLFLKRKMEKAKKKEEKEKKKKEEKKKEEKKPETEEKSEEEKIEEEKRKEQEKELHKEVKHEPKHMGHEVKSKVIKEVHKTQTKK